MKQVETVGLTLTTKARGESARKTEGAKRCQRRKKSMQPDAWLNQNDADVPSSLCCGDSSPLQPCLDHSFLVGKKPRLEGLLNMEGARQQEGETRESKDKMYMMQQTRSKQKRIHVGILLRRRNKRRHLLEKDWCEAICKSSCS